MKEHKPMSIALIQQRYHPDISDAMLDSLFDTPVSDLVEELLHFMGQEKTDKWAKQIQEDNELKYLYKNNLGCV
jgi:hypothetical protein